MVTNSISFGRMYKLPHHPYMFGGYQAKISSIAASVDAMLDGEALNDIQKHEDEPPGYLRPRGTRIRIGIGLNSGPAMVGNIGSSRRMKYTAIGATVNLPPRLESAAIELS